jgi:hypothetical protein
MQAGMLASLLWPLVAALAGPPPNPGRPPDFVLVSKRCVQITSKLGGHTRPLHIEHPQRSRESCWRSGAEVTCQAGESSISLRVHREAGPKLFLTGEGGLVMLSLDWSTSSFANGITYFNDEVGIAHVQCTGNVVAGDGSRSGR